jgi:6-phosphofructokinase 1
MLANRALRHRTSSEQIRSRYSFIQDETCEMMPTWAVRAGARRQIYFEPRTVTAAIVTCGGLCPGLNDVVQGLVNKLEDYGVQSGRILGIRCGT